MQPYRNFSYYSCNSGIQKIVNARNPLVSAFYAEHYEKRISFNAHIYTKSKFLGLSVCVYNIGQGIVSVLDYDEEYYLTFPNGYGRSILTVPWIELGGTVQITCPKTGNTRHLYPFFLAIVSISS